MTPVLLTDTVSLDLSRAVHYTLLWGMEGVALRAVGGAERRVPHVDASRIASRLQEAELPVTAVDPGLFEAAPERRALWLNDLVTFDEVAAVCTRLGCDLVVVGALAEPEAPWSAEAAAEVLRQAGGQAVARGLRLAVRNDAATPCAAGEALAELLTTTGHAAVGAAWSPADATAAGHSAASGLRALVGSAQVFAVFVIDGEVGDGAWYPRPLGEGAVGWEEQVAALHASGFDGPLCLTVEEEPRAGAGLRDATALLRLVRSAQRTKP